MIEVHLLRYALAAADSGSFSRAAAQFRVKQSTLSKRVRHLELRLGLDLFDRSTQGVAPTPVGLHFLARARTILGDLETLSRDTLELANGNKGSLRMGFQSSLASGDLKAVLDAYRSAFPDVELQPVEGSREALLAQIGRDRLDLAVVAGEFGETRLRAQCLWSEPLTIAMAGDHPLAENCPLYWTDLRGMTFLVTAADPGRLISAIIHARLAGASYVPRIVAQAISRENLPSFADTHSVAAVSGALAISDPAIVLRPVHDAFGPTRIDQNLYWRDGNANPALHRFLALVARRYGQPLKGTVPESGRPPREGGA